VFYANDIADVIVRNATEITDVYDCTADVIAHHVNDITDMIVYPMHANDVAYVTVHQSG